MQRSKGDPKVALRIKDGNRAVSIAIKASRQNRELSQDQIAQSMGWSSEVISNIEKRRRNVTVSELIVIAEAMGEHPADVFLRVLQWRRPGSVAKGANARGANE
jgi:transcriptional regulator with XRE-family HTH domain